MVHNDPLFPGAVARLSSFPKINHIDDIAHRVDPERGIHIFPQDDILILRYVTARPNTFETELDLECRSLVFDRDSGDILSRSLHKFFNLGEREGLADLDFSGGADLSLKIDGTMLSGFTSPKDPNTLRFHTKGGLTGHASRGLQAASSNIKALALEAIAEGGTPTFEWTGPDNRIIISYEDTNLRLLAIRDRITGVYRPDLCEKLCRKHNVERPANLDYVTNLEEATRALTELSTRTDIEGVVLTFSDGHRVKWKTVDYALRHKVLGNISHERRVYQCWMEGLADDTSAALGGDRGRALLDFMEQIEASIDKASREIEEGLAPLKDLPPAQRAIKIREAFPGLRQSIAFSLLKDVPVRDAVLRIMSGKIGSEEGRATLKAELGLPSWDIDIQALR